MLINTNNIVSVTDANKNFTQITKMVDELGAVCIFKNNKFSYVLIDASLLERAENEVNRILGEIALARLNSNAEYHTQEDLMKKYGFTNEDVESAEELKIDYE